MPEISIKIRIIIKNARWMPSQVTVIRQKLTRTVLPSVKNTFRIPVNTRIITNGFIPLRIAFTGIREIATENAKNAIEKHHPYALDASSGAETDGVKDKAKIEKLIKAVRSFRQ